MVISFIAAVGCGLVLAAIWCSFFLIPGTSYND